MIEVLANKPAYQEGLAAFEWRLALDALGWSGQSTVDLAATLVDRHVQSGQADRTAIVWIGADGPKSASRLASLLQKVRDFATCYCDSVLQKATVL